MLDTSVKLQFSYRRNLPSAVIDWFGAEVGWAHVDAVLPANDPLPGWLLGARSDRPVLGAAWAPRRERRWNGVYCLPAGVQVRPPNYLFFARTAIVEIPCTAAQVAEFYRLLHAQLGKPYSEATIAGFALGCERKVRGAWVCSVLIAWCACEAGILPRELFRYVPKLTPDLLYLVALTARHLLRIAG